MTNLCNPTSFLHSHFSADALGAKVDDLKSGRGAVLESGHFLILGWSDKILPLLEQICMGCEDAGGATVRKTAP